MSLVVDTRSRIRYEKIRRVQKIACKLCPAKRSEFRICNAFLVEANDRNVTPPPASSYLRCLTVVGVVLTTCCTCPPSLFFPPMLVTRRGSHCAARLVLRHQSKRHHHNIQPAIANMKFSSAALSLFFVNPAATSAWTSHHLGASRARVLATHLHSSTASSTTTEVVGEEATESFRLKFLEESKTISPWHDIPLKNDDGSFNMVRPGLCSFAVSTRNFAVFGANCCRIFFISLSDLYHAMYLPDINNLRTNTTPNHLLLTGC